MRASKVWASAVLLVLLPIAGCGGGADEPAAEVAPPPSAAPAPAPASIPEPAPPSDPAPVAAPSTPAPRAVPAKADPEIQRLVHGYIDMFYGDRLDELWEHFSPDMKEGMDREKLGQFRDTVREQFGPETRVLGEETAQKDIYRALVRWARHEKTEDVVEFHWRLRDDDTIAGLWMNPARKKIQIIDE